MRANLRSRPIETTVVDYQGNIVAGAEIVIKYNTPTGSVVADKQTSDETGFIRTVPLPNGKYDLFYQNIYTSTISHFHDITIPAYTAVEESIKPKLPFEVLKNEERLSEYAFFLQIENVDVSSYGNTYPILDFDPTSFSGSMGDLSDFFNLDSASRLTLTRFDIEFYIPITSKNKTSRTVRFAGVPGIRFFSESQIVVPIDYHSTVLKHPVEWFNYSAGIVSASTPNSSKMIITGTGDALLELLRKANIGDILEVSNTSSGSVYTYTGIIVNISADGSTVTLERITTKEGDAMVPNNSNVETIKVWQGLRSLANTSVFDNFSVFENIQAQDGPELYNYPELILS